MFRVSYSQLNIHQLGRTRTFAQTPVSHHTLVLSLHHQRSWWCITYTPERHLGQTHCNTRKRRRHRFTIQLLDEKKAQLYHIVTYSVSAMVSLEMQSISCETLCVCSCTCKPTQTQRHPPYSIAILEARRICQKLRTLIGCRAVSLDCFTIKPMWLSKGTETGKKFDV